MGDNQGILTITGANFIDESKRSVFLRGVNLGGGIKTPVGVPSNEPLNFFDDVNVSFIGRPFPLSEADEHFGRLKYLGYNFLRFNITWEALEHAGPGIYDKEYIEYVIAILFKAQEHGFRCFIDPHQDVWSRFSGGSGAPGWTLKLAGLNPETFSLTEAAIVHNTYPNPEAFPKMIWPSNYFKLACATMFTLFFAGHDFAPNCLVPVVNLDGNVRDVNIQEFLQDHYINAISFLARHVVEAGLAENMVVGYDTLNEPSEGFIGLKSLSKISASQSVTLGHTPTPLQTMQLGRGLRTQIDVYKATFYGFGKSGSVVVDPKGVSAWLANRVFPHVNPVLLEGRTYSSGCIWENHGVWDANTGKVLKDGYFATVPLTGEVVEFDTYFKQFVNKYAKIIRAVQKEAMIFIEPPVNAIPPKLDPKIDVVDRVVYAPHWYDGYTLVNKSWNSFINVKYLHVKRGLTANYLTGLLVGLNNIRNGFTEELALIKREGKENIGDVPVIIGEFGIPYDMNNKAAYTNNDYSAQTTALDANFYGLEHNTLNFSLWNYCPDNSHKWGDNWNGEDLSIFSRFMQKDTETMVDPLSDFSVGLRALKALARPAALLVPGDLKTSVFNLDTREYICAWSHADIPGSSILELYVPRAHYPSEAELLVVVENSLLVEVDLERQRVWVMCQCATKEKGGESEHKVVIKRKGNPEKSLIKDEQDFYSLCPGWDVS
ncbi:hypothetical protein HK096_003690 [Nowakowskiella sp. JEL0078]|nr:hypothetical protein HK096_003690 [Nowakowskiella sp. JEL0078]